MNISFLYFVTCKITVIICAQEVHHIRKELLIQTYTGNLNCVIAASKYFFCF